MARISILKSAEGPVYKKQTLSINKRKKKIKARVNLFFITDGEFKVAYIPALNLTGYGKNNKEALEMLNEIGGDYFQSLVETTQAKIQSELSKYGWKKGTFKFNKQFENTTYIDKDGVLRNFKLPEGTPIEESMAQVA